MNTKRPKIQVPYEQIDVAIELLNISLLLLIWGYAIVQYSNLPDTIAIHFNAQGKPDDYGSKIMIWILPAIATFVYMLLFILNKFPHIHNYLININEENALKNYRLSTRVMRIINLFCLLLFAVITYDIVSLSKGNESAFLSMGLLIFAIVVPILIVIFAFYYQRKINK